MKGAQNGLSARKLKGNQMWKKIAAFVLGTALVGIGSFLTKEAIRLRTEVDNFRSEINRLTSPGTMLANVDPTSQPPDGWHLCPNSGERTLLGTYDPSQAGQVVGPILDANVLKTGYEVDGELAFDPPEYPEGADNGTGNNWVHRHEIPALKVRFFCKQ